jgi:hypothetical protein
MQAANKSFREADLSIIRTALGPLGFVFCAPEACRSGSMYGGSRYGYQRSLTRPMVSEGISYATVQIRCDATASCSVPGISEVG